MSPNAHVNFLSDVAKKMEPPAIVALNRIGSLPGMLSLAAGKPNQTLFPFQAMRFDAPKATDPTSSETISIEPRLLSEALQYLNEPTGFPGLLEWIFGLQEHEHKRARSDAWRVSVTNGSQDALFKAMTCILNPGDSVFVENPCYTGAISQFRMLGYNMIEIETDSDGIVVSHLRSLLSNWPESKPIPKCLYTACGANPTGVTTTKERRIELLQLARQYNFLILEDDPVYFLYFGPSPRPPSYFALEAETLDGDIGRVVRLDSFSKIISAGMRVGWVTGPTTIVNAIDAYTSTTALHVSAIAQCLILSVVQNWGLDGFLSHTSRVASFYKQKRDTFEAAMHEHLDGLAKWATPDTGLFFWVKINLGGTREANAFDMMKNKAQSSGVIALPGSAFLATPGPSPYIRLSFSLLEGEDVNEAVRRLAALIRSERDGSE